MSRQKRTCIECRWWQEIDRIVDELADAGGSARGICRRYPPSGVETAPNDYGRAIAIQPFTEWDDWCGEFHPKRDSAP